MDLPDFSRLSRSFAAARLYGDDDDSFFGGFLVPEGPKSSPAGIQQKQTAEGIHLLMDMPGLSKEDVKLMVKENMLIVKGEGKIKFGDEDGIGRSYNAEFELPPKKSHKIEAIKAEMKNGVLKVTVPKIKDEDRTDVFKVNIQ